MNPLKLVEVEKAIGRRPRGGEVTEFLGVSTDSRTARPGDLFVAIVGENFDGHDFVGAAFEKGVRGAVVSRPVDLTSDHSDKAVFVVDDTIRALGEIARHYRSSLDTNIIGITGSNGKTTTKEMTVHLLSKHARVSGAKKSFNNFIGVPLTLFSIDPGDDYAVIEMGTNAPGEIARLAEIARPGIGVITNVSATHLAGLGSEEGVANAKAELLDAISEEGAAVLNRDNPWTARIRPRCRGRIITFGEGEGADVRAEHVRQNGEGLKFSVEGRDFIVPVMGRHNVLNALAAAAVCRYFGLDLDEISADLRDFELPPMRLQRSVLGGATFINDAYNANPVSMAASIATFAGLSADRKIFVCGDMLELGEGSPELHREVGRKIAEAGADVMWAVGEQAAHAADAAIEAGMAADAIHRARTSKEAGEQIVGFVRPGDVVLLKGSRGMALEKILDCVRAELTR
ncbi:MAG: UDP-N-acetylmuramoyl-tripeptide--D-alanyl-D-alanine ligase [Planctomycetes bacterium]|nr:UDP-N-acetylmuramoyl-tripeptide--D-alanyl-D-alanine ligase [Planctomycetota bacterium]